MTPPAHPPTDRCHNCRRQRLRCDRTYPQCNKCINAGKECLGYGKLYRWTGAVASRGKLAGRTSSAPLGSASLPELSAALAKSEPKEAPVPVPIIQSDEGRELTPAEGSGQTPEDAQLVSRSTSPLVPFGRLRSLADPLYQDMQHSNRYYLSYFANRVCRDLVAQDVPDRNPFRGILRMTGAHPLLQHIIVAASAAHMANLIRAPLAFLPKGLDTSASSGVEVAAHRALKDALVAKSKALTLMQAAVENIQNTSSDVILAAALFFINAELIESGKHGWKAHLNGAARIIAFSQPSMATDSALRDYVLSDCFIYLILAGTLTPASYFDSQSFFQPETIPLVLRKTAANSYLCCPPEILTILYSASKLSNGTPDVAPQEEVRVAASALLQAAQAVDVHAWAGDIDNIAFMQDAPIQSRLHVGSAHRTAACLYILQVFPSLNEMQHHDELAEQLSRDIFEHLSSVPDDDPNFKATTWPTFIAGAQSSCNKRREWVIDRFQRLAVCCPWGFLRTAMETLRQIWDLDPHGQNARRWLQVLRDPDMNILVV